MNLKEGVEICFFINLTFVKGESC